MKFLRLQFVVAGILVLVAGAALADQGGVKLSMKEGIGSYLADADGKTLYWFMKDSPGKSACAGTCLEKWPVFFRETVAPPAGIEAKDFSMITREDGKKQTTFRGYPLYYYAADMKAGDTVGQGVNAVWFVINPAAFPAKAMAPMTEPHKGMAPGADAHKGMSTPAAAPPAAAPPKTY
jgi:predicted lipoprotein with Yx(FWY)xxD motif